MKIRRSFAAGLVVVAGIAGAVWTFADSAYGQGTVVAPGLVLPRMNPQNGKKLFASKGCVVCHQVRGIGGTDAPPLDVTTMDPVMNPFDFLAKMWRGAKGMIAVQEEELGGQIDFTGQELADIVAFLHNRAAQQTFVENDIPENIRELMEHMEGGEQPDGGAGMKMDGGGTMGGAATSK